MISFIVTNFRQCTIRSPGKQPLPIPLRWKPSPRDSNFSVRGLLINKGEEFEAIAFQRDGDQAKRAEIAAKIFPVMTALLRFMMMEALIVHSMISPNRTHLQIP